MQSSSDLPAHIACRNSWHALPAVSASPSFSLCELFGISVVEFAWTGHESVQ